MAQKPKRHVVVVDGSNLATEGRTLPSLRQLDEAVRAYAQEDSNAEIVVVVDASFEHRIDAAERDQLVQAELHGEVVSPPAGAIGRGDAFVLRIAERTGARVLSNDSFQEFHAEHPWLFDEGRLVGGKPVPGIGWIFTPRLPVRGPKSRQVTGKARRTADVLSPPVKAAELAKAAKKAAARKVLPLPPGVTPKVGDVWTALAAGNGHDPAPARGAGTQVAHAAATKAPSKKVPAEKAPSKKASAEKAPSKKASAEKPPSKKASAEKAPSKKVPAKKVRVAEALAEDLPPENAGAATTAGTKKARGKVAAAKAMPATKKAANKEPAKKKAAAKKEAAAKKAPASRVAAKVSPAKKAPAKKAPAKKAPAKKAAIDKAPANEAVPDETAAADASVAEGTPPGADAPRARAARTAREDPAVRVAIDQAVAEALSPPEPPADGNRGRAPGNRNGKQRGRKDAGKDARKDDGKDDAAKGKRRRRRVVGPPPAVNEPLAFITFVAEYPLQSEFEGEVVSFTSHGAMVDVDLPGGRQLHCYIPLAAMGDPPPAKARQILTRGERRTFVLVGLDPPRRVAELALPGIPVDSGAVQAGAGSP